MQQESGKAVQLFARRTGHRWLHSSATASCGTAGGKRLFSVSYEHRRIASLTAIDPFAHTAMSGRRRQRPVTISIPSPSLGGIRTYSSSSSSSSNRSDGGSKTRTKGNPISSSPANAGDSATTADTVEGSSNATAPAATTSDPSMVTWVDDYLPPSLRPYAHLSRMDKPIGTWLLLWPCYWSTAMAAGVPGTVHAATTTTSPTQVVPPTTSMTLMEVLPDPKLLGLFTVGAFVMRGAGCTINDLWDRDLDRRVARTKTRPLAAGILTPPQAIGWLGLQLAAGLGVLVSLPHTEYCFWWGTASLPLVVAYPLMKRCFDYPQLVLGLCFNWGAFMGWAATHGSMDLDVIGPLYAGSVAWTMGYDTLYAHQDKEDDAKLGLKSTAITFGQLGGEISKDGDDDDESRHKRVLYGLAAATYSCWVLSGYNLFVPASPFEEMESFGLVPFGVYSLGVTGAFSHLVWQIQTADLQDPHNLAERFRSNAKVGGIVFASILAGKLAVPLVG